MATRVGSYRADVQNMLKEVLGKHITEVYSDDPKDFKKVMKELWERAKELPNGIQDVLSFLPELSEQGTRFGYFKKSYKKWRKKGYTHKQAQLKAGIDTKDITLDFNRAGRQMRYINQWKAFANAGVQGLYKTVETIERAPIRTLSKMTIVAVIWGMISALYGDDDELDEVNEQTKRDNFVLKVGNTVIKVKKPQESGLKIYLSLVETLVKIELGKEPKKAWNEFFKVVLDEATTFNDIDTDKGLIENVASIVTPTALESTIEAGLDHDFYYGNQITPYGTEDNSSQYQYDAYTSETAKRLGQTQIAKKRKS